MSLSLRVCAPIILGFLSSYLWQGFVDLISVCVCVCVCACVHVCV